MPPRLPEHARDLFIEDILVPSWDPSGGFKWHPTVGFVMPSGQGDHAWRDEALLREMYEERELSSVQIADRLGCAKRTVLSWLERHGIDRRENPHHYQAPAEIRDEDQLREWYVKDGMTLAQIAEKVGCGQSTVGRWISRHDITARDSQYTPEVTEKERDLIREMYTEGGMSSREVGEELGYDCQTILDHLDDMGVDRRGVGLKGQANPRWSGGKPLITTLRLLIGDESWYRTRRNVREDASRQCEMCGCEPEDQSLDVHHIVPIMAGGCNESELLMALCRSCHATAENYTANLFDPVLTE